MVEVHGQVEEQVEVELRQQAEVCRGEREGGGGVGEDGGKVEKVVVERVAQWEEAENVKDEVEMEEEVEKEVEEEEDGKS